MFHAQQIDDQMFYQPAPQRGAGGWGTVLPFLMLLVFVVFVLKEPLANLTKERADRAAVAKMATEQQVSYAALAESVAIQLQQVRTEFHKLRTVLEDLDAQTEEVLHTPVDLVPDRLTRRVAHAILLSDQFAEAFVQVLNARITEDTLDHQAEILTQVNLRMNAKTLSNLDTLRLEDLREWIHQRQQRLERQRPAISQMRSCLTELRL